MKSFSYALYMLCAIAFLACDNTEVQEANSIKLISPSGIVFASNLGELKQSIKSGVSSQSGSESDFDINGISYEEHNSISAGFVSYKTANGYENTIVISRTSYKDASGKMMQETRKLWCERRGSCSCLIQGTHYPDGRYEFSCGSCEDCTLVWE